MGSFDDFMDQIELADEELEDKILENARAGLWRTRDDRLIPIHFMSDDHIRNTINLFEGRLSEAPGAVALPYLRQEQRRRQR